MASMSWIADICSGQYAQIVFRVNTYTYGMTIELRFRSDNVELFLVLTLFSQHILCNIAQYHQ